MEEVNNYYKLEAIEAGATPEQAQDLIERYQRFASTLCFKIEVLKYALKAGATYEQSLTLWDYELEALRMEVPLEYAIKFNTPSQIKALKDGKNYEQALKYKDEYPKSQESLNKELVKAFENNNSNEIELLIKEGAKLDYETTKYLVKNNINNDLIFKISYREEWEDSFDFISHYGIDANRENILNLYKNIFPYKENIDSLSMQDLFNDVMIILKSHEIRFSIINHDKNDVINHHLRIVQHILEECNSVSHELSDEEIEDTFKYIRDKLSKDEEKNLNQKFGYHSKIESAAFILILPGFFGNAIKNQDQSFISEMLKKVRDLSSMTFMNIKAKVEFQNGNINEELLKSVEGQSLTLVELLIEEGAKVTTEHLKKFRKESYYNSNNQKIAKVLTEAYLSQNVKNIPNQENVFETLEQNIGDLLPLKGLMELAKNAIYQVRYSMYIYKHLHPKNRCIGETIEEVKYQNSNSKMDDVLSKSMKFSDFFEHRFQEMNKYLGNNDVDIGNKLPEIQMIELGKILYQQDDSGFFANVPVGEVIANAFSLYFEAYQVVKEYWDYPCPEYYQSMHQANIKSIEYTGHHNTHYNQHYSM